MTLTATQKIKLHDLHGKMMVADCVPTGHDAKRVSNLNRAFTDYYTSLGLDLRQAEALSWETSQSFEATMLEAIKEGYIFPNLTPSTIEYLERMAA